MWVISFATSPKGSLLISLISDMTNDTKHRTNDTPVQKLEEVSNLESVLGALGSPIDPRHIKTRQGPGGRMLDYLDWACYVRHLNHRCPGWTWVIEEVNVIGSYVFARGTLTIPYSHGVLTYSGVSSELLDTNGAPPIETCCSRALARAAAMTGLSLALWEAKR